MSTRKPSHFWTVSEIETLTHLYPDTETGELARQLGLPVSSLHYKAASLGIKKSDTYLASAMACRLRRGDNIGAACRFRPGHQTWNKGMKGLHIGGKETQFRPGDAPHNTLDVGSYRITRDGTLQRKIGTAKGSNSKRWRGVHELVWIEANGPLPDGHICVFKPGARTAELSEITPDKVECITLAENMRRNSSHRYGKEIARLVQLRGALTRTINRRMNNV